MFTDTEYSPEKYPDEPPPWIGVDLDGTLAYYDDTTGFDRVGKIVKDLAKRIRRWQELGYTVKIFTARASMEETLPPIRKWLKKHKLGDLEITNKLDRYCVEIWDDRAVQVKPNTGIPFRSLSVNSHPRSPLLEEAFPHEDRPKLEPVDEEEQ